ncbi:MAG: hypothetical protein ACR2PW_02660 [Gammaproteobacteria bacterium]
MDDLLSVQSGILELLIGLVIGIAGTLAFSIKFDVNAFLDRRDKKRIGQLQNICPHIKIYRQGDQTLISSLMQSPSGTLQWQCKLCKVTDYTDCDMAHLEFWLNHQELYLERKEEIKKILRKLSYLP